MANLCPFCRQGAASVISGASGMRVMCHACGADGPFRYLAADATSAWNTRPIEDELRARIAELERDLTAEKKCHYLAARLIGERDARLEEAGKRIATLENLLSQLANEKNDAITMRC